MPLNARLFLSAVAVLTVATIVRLVRTGRLREKYALLWLAIGTVIVVLTVFPQVLETVSAWVGIAYPPATLFTVAIVSLLLICVHFSRELSRLEEQVRILAEELALRQAEAAPVARHRDPADGA